MTRDSAAKGFILLSMAAGAGRVAAGGAVDRGADEAGLTAKLAEATAAGEAAYADSCTACHGLYDPRFYMYAGWKAVVESRGCPKAEAGLEPGRARAVLGYLRASAAGSEDEALRIREGERKTRRLEMEIDGAETFKALCRKCHGHPLYTRTRTAPEWKAVFDKGLKALHPASADVPDPGLRLTHALRAHLAASAACGPADAKIFRILVQKGGGAIDFEPDDEFAAVRWLPDYEKALALAAEKKIPLLLDLTIEGGT